MSRFFYGFLRFFIFVGVSQVALTGLQANIVVTNVQMEAVQQVNLLGIDATLKALGVVTFTFDVDANQNTVAGGGASSVNALFTGFLPSAFQPLGVAGAPFELFSINTPPPSITTSNNGKHVRIDTAFGLRVFAAPNVIGANFYTTALSIFESDVVSLTNFAGVVLQAPNRPLDVTQIFIGDSIVPGLPPSGTPVGSSFNRTVTAVPEPSSLILGSLVGIVGAALRRRQSNRDREFA